MMRLRWDQIRLDGGTPAHAALDQAMMQEDACEMPVGEMVTVS